jgi:hypothetical protein
MAGFFMRGRMTGMIAAIRIITGILGTISWAIAVCKLPKYTIEYFDKTRLTAQQLKNFERNRAGFIQLRRALPYLIAGVICFVICGLLSPR